MAYARQLERWLVAGFVLVFTSVLTGCGIGAPAVPDEPGEATATPTPTTIPTAAATDAATPTPTTIPTAAATDAATPTPTTIPTDTAEIITTTWQWTAFEDTAGQNSFTVEEPENYTLTFNADGTLGIQADCNSASGSYMLDNGGLSITLGPTTLAECGPTSRYARYLRWLRDVASYVRDDEQLFLNLRLDGGTLVFERNPEPAADAAVGTPRYEYAGHYRRQPDQHCRDRRAAGRAIGLTPQQ
jgi:heat shock protein HslJ